MPGEMGLLRDLDEDPRHYIAIEPVAEFLRLSELMVRGSLAMQMENCRAYREAGDRLRAALKMMGCDVTPP